MLQLKVNKKNTDIMYQTLPISAMTATDNGDTIIYTFITDGTHGLMNNEAVSLRRVDGKSIDFTSIENVSVIDGTTFSIEKPKRRRLYFSGAYIMNESPTPTEKKIYVAYSCTEDYPHNIIINRDDVEITQYARDNDPIGSRCPKYFLYNDKFLYSGTTFDDNRNLGWEIDVNDESVNVLIPYTNSNMDNKYIAFRECSTIDEANSFIESFYTDQFFVEDTMFFDNGQMQNGVFIEKSVDALRATIAFGSDFYTNGLNEDKIAELTNIDALNAPTDYEKAVFRPCTEYGLVEKINFGLYFQHRNWEGGRVTSAQTGWTNNLESIGYTNDDIKYRRNNFTKSFLRLLFYDTNDPRTQTLLGYYSVYFDVNDAYNQVINGIVVSGITTEMKISNPIIGDGACEGFNIHLFPNILEGKEEETIYMATEFNHAKYGYTLKMTIPVDDSGSTVDPSTVSYYNGDDELDMKKLCRNMYTEVKIWFDGATNEYKWCPKPYIEEETLDINLYEPKLK